MKHAAQTNLTYRYAKIAFCVKKRTGKRKEDEMWGLGTHPFSALLAGEG